jgi:indolepyruvate ferredoxin oxidoreductase beta subunit
MKYDLILCGVGGQGGISVSIVIARAAMASGLAVKQSEVHGMAQRGGEVLAHLRLSDAPIASPLIPLGSASLILSFEPLEALRYLPYLAAGGAVVTATAPFRNIPNYPDIDEVLAELRALEASTLVDAANMVLVGAASRLLPVSADSLRAAVSEIFARKGDAVVEANLRAFEHGRAANP